MLKYISRVHENHSDNPIKLIVYLLICFDGVFNLALAAVYILKAISAWNLL